MSRSNVAIISPELSVVIPVLNEAATLPDTLANLAGQQLVNLEVIVSDGGSADGSPAVAERLASSLGLSLSVTHGPQGRAIQLNRGAAASRGEFLLFLHADSHFSDQLALRQGIDALADRLRQRPDGRVAGRFRLVFRRSNRGHDLAYTYYQRKARLDRPGCTHGDQGFLLNHRHFVEVGPFAESLPMLTETLLAEKIRRHGEWCLLPPEITTSARRFETEGLRQRQTLNLLIMALAAVGHEQAISSLRGPYVPQETTERLRLAPFFRTINTYLAHLPELDQQEFWRRVGVYVRDNAWQIPFFLDVWRGRNGTDPSGEGGIPLLGFWDRRLAPLVNNSFGRLIATCLARAWFVMACRYEP